MGIVSSIIAKCHPLLRKEVNWLVKDGENMGHIAVGEIGEKIARLELQKMGRKILYKNYRGPKGGEVDIVARDGDVLSFVEVKTRRKRETSRPLDAVNAKKQELIKRGARSWLSMLDETNFIWRYDVVEVELTEGEVPQVTVVNGAFD